MKDLSKVKVSKFVKLKKSETSIKGGLFQSKRLLKKAGIEPRLNSKKEIPILEDQNEPREIATVSRFKNASKKYNDRSIFSKIMKDLFILKNLNY